MIVPLRVATWNIHRGVGRDGRVDIERIAAVLQEISADIIGLQEVGFWSGEHLNVLEYFATITGAAPIEGITLENELGHYGNAVLTRLPVHSMRQHDFSISGREPRGAIDLKLKLGRTCIRFVSTHLGLRPAERRYQVQYLLKLFEEEGCALDVLLGDLNEWFLFGRPLRRLHRCFGAQLAPATFPSGRPLFALDRLWTRPRAAVKRLRVHSSPLARVASDHLPLLADLELDLPQPGDAIEPS
tara:strand:+ start:7995 stop:8723 length:729 start_codon:yes stop_codon:yes gene_type:complete